MISHNEKIVAVDEALFLHDEYGSQICGIGAKQTSLNNIWIDMLKVRNSQGLEIFADDHVEAGNAILENGWSGYSFLTVIILFGPIKFIIMGLEILKDLTLLLI